MKIVFVLLSLLVSTRLLSQAECIVASVAGGNLPPARKAFEAANLVMVGEFHGVLGANELKLQLVQELNTNFGFTHVFMEIGTAAAYLYNTFLTTGDTALLNTPGMPYCIKKKEKAFWINLHLYNLTRPDSQKIIIHGVDFERLEFLKALKMLLPSACNTGASDFTRKLIAEYDQLMQNTDNYNTFNKIFSEYKQTFKADITAVAKVYGNNFNYVERIFNNRSSQEKFKQRNETMYENIMETIQQRDIQRAACFFGLNHTNGDKSYTLIGKLAASGQFNKIVNLSMLCKNCYDWQQYVKLADYSGPYTYQRDKALIESIFNQFYITNDCRFTIVPTSMIKNDKVQSFSDYLLLLKDQTETE